MLKKDSYIEIVVKRRNPEPVWKAKVADLFEEGGFDRSGLVISEWKGDFQTAAYLRSARTAKRLEACLRRGRLRPRLRVLEKDDWLEKWKLDYHIAPLGRRFAIVPLWEKEKWRGGTREPILLDPGSAFGSGMHETTSLVLRLMETLTGRFDSFFDVGAGTGILSIAARRLGARVITGIDLDGPSVRAARRNMTLNGIRDARMVTSRMEAFRPGRRFDLVGCNVISDVLLRNAGRLVSWVRPGGWLIISGIHLKNLGGVRTDFPRPSLKCLKVLKGRGWAGILYRKSFRQ